MINLWHIQKCGLSDVAENARTTYPPRCVQKNMVDYSEENGEIFHQNVISFRERYKDHNTMKV